MESNIFIKCRFEILFKTLADRIKMFLRFLISSNQTAYVKERFISKSEILFSDILQVADFLKLRGLLVTVDLQKTFDSVNHLFLITALKNSALLKHLLSG